MVIQAILFDKDGTLLDFNATWAPIYRGVVARLAPEDLSLQAHLLAVAGHDHDSDKVGAGTPLAAGSNSDIAAVWHPHLDGREAASIARALDDAFDLAAIHAVAVDRLRETLLILKQSHYRLGVATSDSEKGAISSLTPFDVLDFFDFVAGYDSGHGMKPTPGMVHGFCKATGLEPGAVAVVGDNSHDMDMGRAAGAGLCVGVLTGTGEEADLHEADHILPSIADLPALLKDLDL